MPKPYSKEHLNLKSLRHLSHRLGIPFKELQRIGDKAESLYRFEKEPKKTGGFREIAKPSYKLKKIQKAIHNLLTEIKVSDCAHGGIRGKSNYTNAKRHCSQKWLLNLDFKNFFPSISNHQVNNLFLEKLQCSPKVASLLTRLCTVRGQVPQGGSMSTNIANLICRKIDRRIEGLCKKYKVTYSRFVDDMSFSAKNIPASFISIVKHIIGQSGYILNPEKEHLLGQRQLQTVTGLSVNRKTPKVPRGIQREWRRDKHLFEKFEVHQVGASMRTIREQQIKGRDHYLQYINRSHQSTNNR